MPLPRTPQGDRPKPQHSRRLDFLEARRHRLWRYRLALREAKHRNVLIGTHALCTLNKGLINKRTGEHCGARARRPGTSGVGRQLGDVFKRHFRLLLEKGGAVRVKYREHMNDRHDAGPLKKLCRL